MQICAKSFMHLTEAIGDVFVIISLDLSMNRIPIIMKSKAIIPLMQVNNIKYLNYPSDFPLKLLRSQQLLSYIITACFFNNNTDPIKEYSSKKSYRRGNPSNSIKESVPGFFNKY